MNRYIYNICIIHVYSRISNKKTVIKFPPINKLNLRNGERNIFLALIFLFFHCIHEVDLWMLILSILQAKLLFVIIKSLKKNSVDIHFLKKKN